MDKPMPGLAFEGMTLFFKVMDLFRNSGDVLDEIEIESGDVVLDFGCGPGRYEPGLSERVGPAGTVYALDIHPLAVRKVERLGLTNVKTILPNGGTGLPDESVDIALLFDVFHMLSEPEKVLAEIYRILKPDGELACAIEHMSDEEAIERIVATGLFHSVDAHIKNLRRKLEADPLNPRYVLTVYGIGYKFADEV